MYRKSHNEDGKAIETVKLFYFHSHYSVFRQSSTAK